MVIRPPRSAATGGATPQHEPADPGEPHHQHTAEHDHPSVGPGVTAAARGGGALGGLVDLLVVGVGRPGAVLVWVTVSVGVGLGVVVVVVGVGVGLGLGLVDWLGVPVPTVTRSAAAVAWAGSGRVQSSSSTSSAALAAPVARSRVNASGWKATTPVARGVTVTTRGGAVTAPPAAGARL